LRDNDLIHAASVRLCSSVVLRGFAHGAIDDFVGSQDTGCLALAIQCDVDQNLKHLIGVLHRLLGELPFLAGSEETRWAQSDVGCAGRATSTGSATSARRATSTCTRTTATTGLSCHLISLILKTTTPQ
jgi:hypothetical protein